MNAENNAPHATDEVNTETTVVAEKPRPGVYWCILLAGLLLLALLPDQASWIDTKRGWFTQPMVGPAIGLTIMTLFAGLRAWRGFRRWHPDSNLLEDLFSALSNYRVAIISGALFFIYINCLPIIGFVPASLIFVTTLLWLSRLLDRFWFGATLFTLFLMVMIFRVGVGLWLPDVWLYEQLPTQWADFANQYL